MYGGPPPALNRHKEYPALNDAYNELGCGCCEGDTSVLWEFVEMALEALEHEAGALTNDATHPVNRALAKARG